MKLTSFLKSIAIGVALCLAITVLPSCTSLSGKGEHTPGQVYLESKYNYELVLKSFVDYAKWCVKQPKGNKCEKVVEGSQAYLNRSRDAFKVADSFIGTDKFDGAAEVAIAASKELKDYADKNYEQVK